MNTQNHLATIHALRTALTMIAGGHDNPQKIAEDALGAVDSDDSEIILRRSGICNWDHHEEGVHGSFDFRVTEVSSNQFGLRISPSGLSPNLLGGSPVIDAMIEISGNGLPCIHLGNDPYDGPLVSIFGTAQGVFVRDGGAKYEPVANAPHPMNSQIAATSVGVPSGVVYLRDTAEKYADSMADEIRDEYRESSQSRADADYAIAILAKHCKSLFENEEAMWNFLTAEA